MPSTGTVTVFVIGLMLILAGAWYYFSGQYAANALPSVSTTNAVQTDTGTVTQ
jgi:hypothetical protein